MSAVAVIGAGYVGLTTSACLAHLGHDVVCAEINDQKLDQLLRGELPIVEPGLGELVKEGTNEGRLTFVAEPADAVRNREYVYLCVQTPQGEDGEADLSFIEAAAHDIANSLDRGAVVVNKSTVPVGSTVVVERALRRTDVSVVSNPEFLREGSAVHDFLHPARIVIGADDRAVAVQVASLYLDIPATLIVTDPASAETIKYAANAFLATKLSFVNAIAAVCEAVGADINDVIAGIGSDPRIGHEYLRPGPGWGGSCLPKDTRALVHIADQSGYDFALLRGVIDVNTEQGERVVNKIRDATGGLAGKTVAVWGLTFKADTDDMRESPALVACRRLIDEGAAVRAYDPAVAAQIDGVTACDDAYFACDGADVLVVMTEWAEFRWLDFNEIKERMAMPSVVDTRNLLDGHALRRKGFEYQGIGRSQ